MSIHYAKVILFRESGKYYTGEEWRIPEDAIGPNDMRKSPDFRRIGTGAVLVESQEPWGYPHLFPSEPEIAGNRSALESRVDALEKRLHGIIETHHLWDGS